jgi:nitrate reductase NapE component
MSLKRSCLSDAAWLVCSNGLPAISDGEEGDDDDDDVEATRVVLCLRAFPLCVDQVASQLRCRTEEEEEAYMRARLGKTNKMKIFLHAKDQETKIHEAKQDKKNYQRHGPLFFKQLLTAMTPTKTKKKEEKNNFFFLAFTSVPVMRLHHIFFIFFLLLLPVDMFTKAQQTTLKKSSCPLTEANAVVTKGNDDDYDDDERGNTKPLRSSCGSDILSNDGEACTICASAIDTLILSRKTLTSEELFTFDMKACAAFFLENGASIKTLLAMKECEREDSSAYVRLLNEENARKQGGEKGETRKEENKTRDPSVLYCFLFFCSFPLLDVGISEKMIPFYFAFVFITSLGVLFVFLCKFFLVCRHQRRRRKEKRVMRKDEEDHEQRNEEAFNARRNQNDNAAMMSPSLSR